MLETTKASHGSNCLSKYNLVVQKKSILFLVSTELKSLKAKYKN